MARFPDHPRDDRLVSAPAPSLGQAFFALLRHPFLALIEGFNWKTAAISAFFRAIMFFFSNLRAGQQLALRATLVEAVYAIVAMGLAGAITERIRNARPTWITGTIVWLVIPALLLPAQYLVHRHFGTPRLRTSMIASFCFAALGTGFNWFAMRRGALLVTGPSVGDPTVDAPSSNFAADLRALPRLILDFLTAAPRALLSPHPPTDP
jgi:hypothetical protein